ncbi:glycosyltransferase family 8 protein [Marinobacter caseinilyticus]|uniref:glycosyltransferase family 8 protein n=1 Tax=Marinobacter caseinilyticus TaxID=2692195 RepID=UPI00140C3F96|nr:glycosyltransferase family 8 protein [Marinobacter caseinilyticus]
MSDTFGSGKKQIHIAACCDQNYLPFVAVMMNSAISRLSGQYNPIFHFVGVDIDQDTLSALKNEVEQKGGELISYQADELSFKDLPTLRYGNSVYQRILLADYLSNDINRVIYIDADTYVVDDLSVLWEMNLQGNPLGAVEDLSKSACKTIKIPRHEYFNSGVLLMDLEVWRRQGIHKTVAAYAGQNAHRLKHVDQCSLNAVLHKKWTRLPARWNQQASVYKAYKKISEDCGYSKEELREAIQNPGIYHFTGREKPWLSYCFSPVKKEYRSALSKLDWARSLVPRESLRQKLEALLSFRKQTQYLIRKLFWILNRMHRN